MHSRHLFILVLLIALLATIAFAEQLQIWPKIEGVPNYYIGLPNSVYGVHPINRETYGEGYFFLGSYSDGSYSFANMFVTNLGPGDQNTSIDISICEPGKECYFAKSDFAKNTFQASSSQMDIRIGDSRASGAYPNFNVKVAAKNLNVNLKYQSQLPGFAINSGRVTYGNNEDYYSNYVLIPRAKVSGTVTSPAGTKQVTGFGYSDHGVVTMMPHKYSRRWFSLRCFDEKYTLDILEFTVPSEYGGKTVPMVIFGTDSKILYGGSYYTLKPSQVQSDSSNGLQLPQKFDFTIDRPGKVKVVGSYVVKKQIEKIDVLSTMSFFERQVARFFAKSFIYRFLVEVNGTVTLPDGTTDTFTAPAVSEVLYIS